MGTSNMHDYQHNTTMSVQFSSSLSQRPIFIFCCCRCYVKLLDYWRAEKNFLYYRRPPWGPRPVAFATSATWLIRHWTWFVLATPVWANERYTVAVIAAAAAAAAVGIYIIVRTSDRFVRYALHAVSREPLPRWRLSRSARLQMLCTGCLELTAENCR